MPLCTSVSRFHAPQNRRGLLLIEMARMKVQNTILSRHFPPGNAGDATILQFLPLNQLRLAADRELSLETGVGR